MIICARNVKYLYQNILKSRTSTQKTSNAYKHSLKFKEIAFANTVAKNGISNEKFHNYIRCVKGTQFRIFMDTNILDKLFLELIQQTDAMERFK